MRGNLNVIFLDLQFQGVSGAFGGQFHWVYTVTHQHYLQVSFALRTICFQIQKLVYLQQMQEERINLSVYMQQQEEKQC